MEPLFQKLINKFEGVRNEHEDLFGNDAGAIQEVLKVIREIQSEHKQFQQVITEPIDNNSYTEAAQTFIKRIF